MIKSIKVSGFKLFEKEVALNLSPIVKNAQHLAENIINVDKSKKVLKAAVIYGVNNSGKSSIIQAVEVFRQIYMQGEIGKFPFIQLMNFANDTDKITYEITFYQDSKEIVYGIAFKNNYQFDEYLSINGQLFFKKDDNDNYSTDINNSQYEKAIKEVPTDKLIVPYICNNNLNNNESNKELLEFRLVDKFFKRLRFIDNDNVSIDSRTLLKMENDAGRLKILDKLIESSPLYVDKRTILTRKELLNSDDYLKYAEKNLLEKQYYDDEINSSLDAHRILSHYKTGNGKNIVRPSFLFDSSGTNKFINLSIEIINALLDGEILLIDNFDNSLHFMLTQALIKLINSEVNNQSQFIISTHDVKLLSPKLLRKDQINFTVRDDYPSIVRLDEFKANSDVDVRSDSNFEKMYTEEKFFDLTETDICEVIAAIKQYLNNA